jgi:signal transduction histidine kinase
MNGIEAMRDRDGERKMSISTSLVDGSSIEVAVADTGTGILPGKLNKIFDAFYTTKSDGTGLGLSIARRIIESFGGKLWAENRPGGGSLFRFTLPLAKTAQSLDVQRVD